MIENGELVSPISPDEAEAMSRKYSSADARILPLSSGAYACFNAQYKLLGITYSLETLILMIHLAQATISEHPGRPNRQSPAKLRLEDLDLF